MREQRHSHAITHTAARTCVLDGKVGNQRSANETPAGQNPVSDGRKRRCAPVFLNGFQGWVFEV
jgi:hypothetical protein